MKTMIIAVPPAGALDPSFSGRRAPASGLEVTELEAVEIARCAGWQLFPKVEWPSTPSPEEQASAEAWIAEVRTALDSIGGSEK